MRKEEELGMGWKVLSLSPNLGGASSFAGVKGGIWMGMLVGQIQYCYLPRVSRRTLWFANVCY